MLGGHDHHYVVDTIEPTKTLMVKSGCDFRDLTSITVELQPGGGKPTMAWERHPITGQVGVAARSRQKPNRCQLWTPARPFHIHHLPQTTHPPPTTTGPNPPTPKGLGVLGITNH